MKTAGIICEYNPFHSGHKYLIDKAKSHGADAVIAFMSGNYVQRGVPAFADKYIRSEAAIHMGADMVIELPSAYSCASSEIFADASISIMDKCGILSHIVFGSECGDIEIMDLLSKILFYEPDDFKIILKEKLRCGNTYAASKYYALSHYLKNHSVSHISKECNIDYEHIYNTLNKYTQDDIVNLLSSPNNNLAIEYLKSINKHKSRLIPETYKRINHNYHETASNAASYSATALRNSILNNDFNNINDIYLKNLYEANYNLSFPVIPDDYSLILGEKLINENEYEKFYGITGDLSNRIKNSRINYKTITSFTDMLKSKNLTYTAVSRALIHIILGITKNDMNFFINNDYCDYVRILGVSDKGLSLLPLLQNNIKTIINPAKDIDNINTLFTKLLSINNYGDELYRLVQMNKFKCEIPNEYTRKFSPVKN